MSPKMKPELKCYQHKNVIKTKFLLKLKCHNYFYPFSIKTEISPELKCPPKNATKTHLSAKLKCCQN